MLIDGREVKITRGMSVLDAARTAGIDIPTLCHDERLEAFGGCRLCIVEVEERGWTRVVVACVFPADDKIVVRTRSEKIDRLRKTILELLLARAPHSPQLIQLGREYGAKPARFENDANFCVLCGLCVRYCNEVKELDAVGFIERGVNKEICFVPEVALKACNACKECFRFVRRRTCKRRLCSWKRSLELVSGTRSRGVSTCESPFRSLRKPRNEYFLIAGARHATERHREHCSHELEAVTKGRARASTAWIPIARRRGCVTMRHPTPVRRWVIRAELRSPSYSRTTNVGGGPPGEK